MITNAKQALGTWMRLGLVALAVVATVGISTTAAAQDAKKIGYVDLQRALNNVEDGQQARAKLKKEFENKQKKLNQRQKEVKNLKQELESQGMALSDEAKKKKQMELRQKMAQLQQLYMKLQKDLSQKEAKATKDIFDKMRTIVKKIAEEKNYDLVLEKTESSVLFANDAMDLTDELIKRYDSD